MKKILTILLCAVLISAFAVGCGVNDPLNSSDPENTEAQIKDTDYPDTIEGIYQYMLALDLISETDPVEMAADLIGAEKGNKYSYKLNGKNVVVELYSYNTDKLSDTAKEIIDSVKTTGKFQILGLDEVEAVMSDSGRYLLIYSDTAFNSKNPNEHNVSVRNSFIDAFKAFRNE